jgi:hypothetical protein
VSSSTRHHRTASATRVRSTGAHEGELHVKGKRQFWVHPLASTELV